MIVSDSLSLYVFVINHKTYIYIRLQSGWPKQTPNCLMVDDVNDLKNPTHGFILSWWRWVVGSPRFAEDDPVTPIASFSDSASPLFIPQPGEMIQFDEHIVQMGWFNHQLVLLKQFAE